MPAAGMSSAPAALPLEESGTSRVEPRCCASGADLAAAALAATAGEVPDGPAVGGRGAGDCAQGGQSGAAGARYGRIRPLVPVPVQGLVRLARASLLGWADGPAVRRRC